MIKNIEYFLQKYPPIKYYKQTQWYDIIELENSNLVAYFDKWGTIKIYTKGYAEMIYGKGEN